MSYKRLTPCVFIYKGKAVRWFDDKEVLSEDVVGLAKYYSDRGADELIVFDLSDSDDRRWKYQTSGRCEKDFVYRSKTCRVESVQTSLHRDAGRGIQTVWKRADCRFLK